MKTQYYAATSLDGFIATEDDSLDWLFSLGSLGDTSYPEFIAEVGALAMGSATYEWMMRNAEKVAAETGSPWPYSQPAWILSSRNLPVIEGANIRFVNGDVRNIHSGMRAAAGARNIWIVGGGDLAGQFYDADLLDELIVQIGSVTLGKGKPLFPRRALSPNLHLVSVRQMGAGMAELRYEVHKDNGAIQWTSNLAGNDVRARVVNDFGPAAQSAATELDTFVVAFPRTYGMYPEARLLRCTVHLAEGDLEKFRHYLKAALADWRDVIYWAEYDSDDKQIHDFNLPFQ